MASRADETKKKARVEKIKRGARENLTAFKRLIYRGYQSKPHLDALDALLMEVTRYIETGGEEGIGRAIIEMPPRHGKTLTTSRLYPAWHLGRNPDHRIMLVSYGASLAEDNSRAARDLLDHPRYTMLWPYVGLSDTSKAVSAWNIQYPYRGGVIASGVRGAVTGKGAHLLIIDDPIKNREEAENKAYRDKLYQEIYQDDLYTRLEPGGAVIIMATRWHEEDLTGQVLRDEADLWHRLKLPALAHEDDPLGRQPGEALWPERYNEEYLQRIMYTNPYRWASLYDQEPMPRGGGLFNYDHIADHRIHPDDLPVLVRVVVAIDPSGSENGDEVGIMVGGISAQNEGYLLYDGSLKGKTEVWARRALALFDEYSADIIVAETNFGGDMVRASLAAQYDAPNLPFKKLTASRGKVIRAEPVSVLYAKGLVHHVGSFPALEREMTIWKQGDSSPNRLDAVVWLFTELLMDKRGKLKAKSKRTV